MPGKDLEIRCPDCGTRIRLDPETGAIIGHGPGERPKDLGEATRQHEARNKEVKDDAFLSALDAERGRKQKLEDLFRQASDKARGSDPEEGPKRPADDRWR